MEPLPDMQLYEIAKSKDLGRYLIAARPIQAGEIIIIESPAVFAPPGNTGPACLGCYQKLEFNANQYRCSGCGWPMCGNQCKGLNNEFGHSEEECEILRRNNISKIIETNDEDQLKETFEIFFPLRCLITKQHNPAKWRQIMEMESHNDFRKNCTTHWSRNQTQIVDRIRKDWGIDEFTEEEIHTICGIIKVNCFGIGLQGSKGRGLYPLTAIMAHDCCPNARTTIHPRTFTMVVRALHDIKKGQSITTSYVDYILGTLKRREQLKAGKFFWCSCTRCSDPTELGTSCSTLRCTKCPDGIVLTTNPLDQSALWRCKQCHYTIEPIAISSLLEKLMKEVETFGTGNVAGLEEFIQKYSNILTENHYLNILAKYSLCQLYNFSNDFSPNMLQHREKLCRDVLKNLDVLKPGLSLARAIIMFNIHVPLLFSAKRAFKDKEIDVGEFRRRLFEVVEFLKQSHQILSLDPDESREQDLARMARIALVTINQLLLKYRE